MPKVRKFALNSYFCSLMNTTRQWIGWGYGGQQADRRARTHTDTHTETQGGNTLMYGAVACLRPIASVHWHQQGPARQGSHSSARSLNTRAKPANTSFRTLASTNKPIVPWISTFLEVLKTLTALQIATRKITTWIFFQRIMRFLNLRDTRIEPRWP